jgi:hypothetical protein
MASSDTGNLSNLTRSKLQSSVAGKDACSLHRWVLLKNSIVRSAPTPEPPAVTFSHHSDPPPSPSLDYLLDEPDDEEEYSYMFPDLENPAVEKNDSEAQWLNSLLETLGDDDDDFAPESEVQGLPVVDDDDDHLSPLPSPMSSSDDLTAPFYPPMPYPPLYAPFQQAARQPYSCHARFEPSSDSPPQDEDGLPYFDSDDVENLSVPDAIDDTSDDESETLTTPSLGQSSQDLYLIDPASVPLPADHSRLRYCDPYIVNAEDPDSEYNPFKFDRSPFPLEHRHRSYCTYHQEC